MPKITATRHIHKTLTYLSPEKFAALRHPEPFKRLPFIHVGKRYVNSYWAVPAKGGYFGGYEVGKLMAKAFFKHMATNTNATNSLILLPIIDALTDRLRDAVERHQCQDMMVTSWPIEPASLRGQRVGFINTIGDVLNATSGSLKSISEATITAHANHALKSSDAEIHRLAEREDARAALADKQAALAAKKAKGVACD